MIISIISAIAKNKIIGSKNGLPWHLPADFKYFKEKTLGKTIILGLNTFKSIGEKPLPNRKHIILCDKPDYKVPENCFLARSIEEALEIAKKIENDPQASSGQKSEIFVCGGAFVYKQFLPLANRLYLTYIHQDFEGDTYFPDFDLSEWKEVKREDHQPDDPQASSGQVKNKWPYSFVVLERI
jgi:dihydrofolate reductase